MSDAMIDKLSTIDLATIVVLIVLVVVLSNIITPLVSKFSKYIISKHKKETKQESLNDLVQKDHERILTYEQNRVHDRAQSFEIQKKLTDCIEDLKIQLAELREHTEQQFKEASDRENKRARAELKDKIGKAYRIYHTTGKWTSIEKESLIDLIAEYESAGGTNSFVHSLVEKEMYSWEIVED